MAMQRLGCAGLLWLVGSLCLPAQAYQVDRYAQVLLGVHRTSDSWYLYEESGRAQLREGRISGIHYLGYFAQIPVDDGILQYGLEFGGHLGYDSRRRLSIFAGGDGSFIHFDTRLWSGDFSAGVFTSLSVTESLRVYASAGPLLYWAQLRYAGERASQQHWSKDNNGMLSSGAVIVDTRSHRYDVGAAFYGRVGAEWMFDSGLTLGVSARRVTTEFDFRDYGYVDLDRVNIMLTFGGRF